MKMYYCNSCMKTFDESMMKWDSKAKTNYCPYCGSDNIYALDKNEEAEYNQKFTSGS